MTFIEGFFLVNFVPFAILTIVGVMLFFRERDVSSRYYYPLLFIIVILVYISLWGLCLPLLSRRYAMPTLVPGIIISVFVIMLLPGILKYFKVKYAYAIVRIAIAALLVACIAKTMRTQEHKTYLRDISEVIKEDCAKYNLSKAALLVFGNPGGILDCDKMVNVVNVENKKNQAKFADTKYQFPFLQGALEPAVLKIQYPHLYLLVIEHYPEGFSKSWEKKFHDKPELIYEYIRDNGQKTYRLYRVRSEYQSAWLNPEDFEETLKNNNVLKNSDFKRKHKLPAEDPIAKKMRNCGVAPASDGEMYLPEGWTINPKQGWGTTCNPVSFKLPDSSTDMLNIRSKGLVSLCTEDMLDGNKTYLLAVQASAGPQGGKLILCTYVYTAEMKYVRGGDQHNIILNAQNSRRLIPLRRENCEKIKLGLIFSGDVCVKSVMAIAGEKTSAK